MAKGDGKHSWNETEKNNINIKSYKTRDFHVQDREIHKKEVKLGRKIQNTRHRVSQEEGREVGEQESKQKHKSVKHKQTRNKGAKTRTTQRKKYTIGTEEVRQEM